MAEEIAPWQAFHLVWLIALTGMRRGEAERLRWSEIDFDRRCLRLSDSKTGESIRPLGEPAQTLLRKVRARAESGLYVFPAPRKSDDAYTGLPKAWERFIAVGGLTPHGLRHGFATMADMLGMTTITIGVLLGHAGHGVTQGYVQRIDPILLSAADRVARTISQAITGETAVVVPLRIRSA